jgi:hypothetical protein
MPAPRLTEGLTVAYVATRDDTLRGECLISPGGNPKVHRE